MRRAATRCVLIFAAFTVMLEARVESTRWWWSPEVAALLNLTSGQICQLDRIYENALPARRRLAEEIIASANRVQQLNDANASDEEVMPATERLTHAQAERCALRSSLLTAFETVLSPEQRRTFRRLLARKLINTD